MKNTKFGNFESLIKKITGFRLRDFQKADDKRFIITGGFCRDTILGVKPKDLDVYVLGGLSAVTMYDRLKREYPEIFGDKEAKVYTEEYDKNKAGELGDIFQGDFAHRINDLVKVNMGGFEIDFIAPIDYARNGLDVISTFDLNINALYYDPVEDEDNISGMVKDLGGWGGVEVLPLKSLEKINPKRIKYLKHKLEGTGLYWGTIDRAFMAEEMLRKAEQEALLKKDNKEILKQALKYKVKPQQEQFQFFVRANGIPKRPQF